MNNYGGGYKACCAIIIISFVISLSILFENSNVLRNIGESSMNFMGLEFITHGWFTLSFLPMINLGIPSINSTIQVIMVVAIQIFITLLISNWINRCKL